jgi:hypothetical protein
MRVKKTKKEGRARSDERRDALPTDEQVDAVLAALRSASEARIRDEMGPRYGIHLPDPSKAFGVRMNAMQ